MIAPIRVLIAESEPLRRIELRKSLEEVGYDVVGEANDGFELVALARELVPDVAVIDVEIANLDGLQVAKELISDYLCAVVLMSDSPDRSLIDQACALGASAYLVKPYQQKELVPLIQFSLFRFREHVLLVEQLESLSEQLDSRKVVDRAKGRLMDIYGLSEHLAFRFIQQHAMAKRETMVKTAEEILDGRLYPEQ